MTMQGQGESQPGEPATLESLASQMEGEEAESGDESGGDEPEESEVEQAEGEQPDEEAESEEADEPTLTLKFEGKEVTVKKSEAIELAQKGMDYSKKTMAHAEVVKALEPIKARIEQRDQHSERFMAEQEARLQAVVNFMTEEIGEPPPIEWATQDAGYYIAQNAQYESRKGKLEKAQHALYQTQQEQHRQRQARFEQQIVETQAALKDTLPDWDNAKEVELVNYVAQQGLTAADSDMAYWKPSLWRMAHKARAYDELMAKKATLRPVAELQKVHKPTANNQPPQLAKRQEAMKAHKAKGTFSTLAELL